MILTVKKQADSWFNFLRTEAPGYQQSFIEKGLIFSDTIQHISTSHAITSYSIKVQKSHRNLEKSHRNLKCLCLSRTFSPPVQSTCIVDPQPSFQAGEFITKREDSTSSFVRDDQRRSSLVTQQSKVIQRHLSCPEWQNSWQINDILSSLDFLAQVPFGYVRVNLEQDKEEPWESDPGPGLGFRCWPGAWAWFQHTDTEWQCLPCQHLMEVLYDNAGLQTQHLGAS